jgi:hypothetical protein
MSVNPGKKIINDWGTIIIACITIGLAPFTPEPHILGKLRWVAGGAVGMQPLDWFDLFLHGTPWLLLLRLIAIEIFKKIKTP